MCCFVKIKGERRRHRERKSESLALTYYQVSCRKILAGIHLRISQDSQETKVASVYIRSEKMTIERDRIHYCKRYCMVNYKHTSPIASIIRNNNNKGLLSLDLQSPVSLVQ